MLMFVLFLINPTRKPTRIFIECPSLWLTKGIKRGPKLTKKHMGKKKKKCSLSEEQSQIRPVCIVTRLSNLPYVALLMWINLKSINKWCCITNPLHYFITLKLFSSFALVEFVPLLLNNSLSVLGPFVHRSKFYLFLFNHKSHINHFCMVVPDPMTPAP